MVPLLFNRPSYWSQAQELANKDAAYKEIQIKLEAMEQHCEVQQQLLQHACNLEYGTGYMNMEDETSKSNNSNNTNNTIANNTTYVAFIFVQNVGKVVVSLEEKITGFFFATIDK